MDAAVPGDGERVSRPSAAEAALALLVAFAFADSSIVVLALPELYGEFETTVVGVSWVVTAYNAAFAAAALVLIVLVGRLHSLRFAIAGLAVFVAASVACAAAPGLDALVAARAAQGVGAALVLAASLPLMVATSGSRARATALWAAAGTVGVAAGPVLGGLLTELFTWRAIFVVQVPVAAAAVPALLHPRARSAPRAERAARRPALGAMAALVLAFAALVGALFLAVLLVVAVLDYGPLAGALIVSALPLAALGVRPLVRQLGEPLCVAAGAGLLAAGLLALAITPTSSLAYVVPALAVAGAGVGLALPPLTSASLPMDGDPARDGTLSVAARHVGLVLGLAAVAPVLAGDPRPGHRPCDARRRRRRAGSAALAGRQGADRARPLPGVRAHARRAAPGPRCALRGAGPGQGRGPGDARPARRARRGCAHARVSGLVRADGRLRARDRFWSARRAEEADVTRRTALGALAAIAVLAAALLLVAVAGGGLDRGTVELRDPCRDRAAFQGGGLDATVQALVLDGLDRAACELDTTREELLLSLDPSSGVAATWSTEEAEEAIRDGLVAAVDAAEDAGAISSVEASLLRAAARRVSLDLILRGAETLGSLLP